MILLSGLIVYENKVRGRKKKMKLFYKIPNLKIGQLLRILRKVFYVSVEAVIMTMLVIKSFTVAYESDINLIFTQLNEIKASIGGFGVNKQLFWFIIKCSIYTIISFDFYLYLKRKRKFL